MSDGDYKDINHRAFLLLLRAKWHVPESKAKAAESVRRRQNKKTGTHCPWVEVMRVVMTDPDWEQAVLLARLEGADDD